MLQHLSLDIFALLLVAGLGIAVLPWTAREVSESWGAMCTVVGWARRLFVGGARLALVQRTH